MILKKIKIRSGRTTLISPKALKMGSQTMTVNDDAN